MILVNENTRVLVQGITGKEGTLHTKLCKNYGTKIVAGTSPGKGGEIREGVPVFNTVKEAKREQDVNTSLIFVPAPFAPDAIMEAVDAELDLVVCITDGIPILDMMKVKKYMAGKKTLLIGPNCPGIIAPRIRVKVGIMPVKVHKPGNIGLISRSGSLTYEVTSRLSKNNLGQSTCIGIGGDPICGLNFVDCLRLFEEDPETDLVCIVGEIGGNAEEKAAEFARQYMRKKLVAYICGINAPKDTRMGHAGAIVSGGKGSAKEKIEKLLQLGIDVALSLNEIPEKVAHALRI